MRYGNDLLGSDLRVCSARGADVDGAEGVVAARDGVLGGQPPRLGDGQPEEERRPRPRLGRLEELEVAPRLHLEGLAQVLDVRELRVAVRVAPDHVQDCRRCRI